MEKQEWKQLAEMKAELDNNLMAFDSYAQEKFTELLVKSLEGKGDKPLSSVTRTP